MSNTSHQQTLASGRASIALVAFSSLGDGLIYLMMAENLRLNGYNVTYYGTLAHQIRHWLPQLKILPYPQPENFEEELQGYDLVIMSPPQFMRNVMDVQTTERLRQKYILICQKAPQLWFHDHTERIRSSYDPIIFEELRQLLNCSGSIHFRRFTHESVVDITLSFMREKMQLQHLQRYVALTPPVGLLPRRYHKRIVVSPDSAWAEKKNWPPQSFIKLCNKLRALGYDPKIVVAPSNHASWMNMPDNDFETPRFEDINSLSAFLYESAAIVANDSGNGHLASFLGVPVVTIYRKRNPVFHWRPAWGAGAVICPTLTFRWGRKTIWKPFISVTAILKAVEQLI